MPDEHSRLAPSASARWLSCPASVLLIEALPYARTHTDTPWTREGTIAHKLGEIVAGQKFGLLTASQYTREYKKWQREAGLSGEEVQVMRAFIDQYIVCIREIMEAHPGSVLMLEQKVDTGIQSCWGTSDVIIVSPTHVAVVDLKYGQGVEVSAVDNPQLKAYGVGALEMFDLLGSIETVSMTIFQPRLYKRSTFTMDADDLRLWRDKAQITAAIALQPGAPFGPSDKACRFCPLAGECRAQLEWATAQDFSVEPELLTEAEIAAALEMASGIKRWLEKLEERALTMAYSEGRHLPGFKVVMSGGRRSIPDNDAALEKLIAAGFSPEKVAILKLKTLGDLEKAVGRKELPVLLGDLLAKGEGKPSLVPESDKRPEIAPDTQAQGDFEAEE